MRLLSDILQLIKARKAGYIIICDSSEGNPYQISHTCENSRFFHLLDVAAEVASRDKDYVQGEPVPQRVSG